LPPFEEFDLCVFFEGEITGFGRSVVVRINERNPLIDVTPAAAHAFGFTGFHA
jgi:hypothetical protein